MTESRRSNWLSYWLDEGCDLRRVQGRWYYRNQDIFPTEEDQWLDVHLWLRSRTERDMETLAQGLEDYASERYCEGCREFVDIRDIIGEMGGQCVDCYASECDAMYDRQLDAMHYPL